MKIEYRISCVGLSGEGERGEGEEQVWSSPLYSFSIREAAFNWGCALCRPLLEFALLNPLLSFKLSACNELDILTPPDKDFMGQAGSTVSSEAHYCLHWVDAFVQQHTSEWRKEDLKTSPS